VSIDKHSIKGLLEGEMSELGLQFDKTALVLERTHPKTLKARIAAFWNKEIADVPVVPLGAAAAILLTLSAVHINKQDPQKDGFQKRQLVEAGGNTYWKDEYEKAVAHNENQNKS
jgi:hypothetical protein